MDGGLRCCCLQKENWKQTLCAGIVRQTRQGKLSAWVGQRIENKELAGGRRMGQNDSQCFMAETKRSKKATTTMQCRRWESSRRQQSETWDNKDRSIIWALWDLFNLDSTPTRNWLPMTGRMVQVWHNAKIYNNDTAGCLARVDSMPDQEETSGSILQKQKLKQNS